MGGLSGNRCLLQRSSLSVLAGIHNCHALTHLLSMRHGILPLPQLPFWVQLADIVGDKALYALLLETTFRSLRTIAVVLQTDLLCMIFRPHDLRSWVQLADIVGDKALYALLLETTFRNLRILLLSERLKTETSERSLLKNLGSWLGKVGDPLPAHRLLLPQLNAEAASGSCEDLSMSGQASVSCFCRHKVVLHGK